MIEEKLYCKTGGCAAKLGAKALDKILSRIKRIPDDNLLVGFEGNDDGAVYKLSDDIAIVETLDFFPALPYKPYDFGRIAAANALSDIFAMGGMPKVALNIVCFPKDGDLNVLGEIIEGSNEMVSNAGAVIAGGHSIVDNEIKYGLAVTGVVHPDKLYKNNEAKKGDAIILTKALGVGIVNTAVRLAKVDETLVNTAINSMTTLNKEALELSKDYNIHSVTDVTGFGLIIHLSEMIGKKGANIFMEELPYFEGLRYLVDEFYITEQGQRNRNFIKDRLNMKKRDFFYEELLFDPQTSGGLLMALPKNEAKEFLDKLVMNGHHASIIGEILDDEGPINII